MLKMNFELVLLLQEEMLDLYQCHADVFPEDGLFPTALHPRASKEEHEIANLKLKATKVTVLSICYTRPISFTSVQYKCVQTGLLLFITQLPTPTAPQ